MTNGQRRKEAIARKENRYMPVRPCRRGHLAERYTVGNSCIACMDITIAARGGGSHYNREWRFKKGMLPRPTRPAPAQCECCGGTQKKGLHLDHDHVTGKFRGWLCTKCNLGIGCLGDTIQAVKRVLSYFERTQNG